MKRNLFTRLTAMWLASMLIMGTSVACSTNPNVQSEESHNETTVADASTAPNQQLSTANTTAGTTIPLAATTPFEATKAPEVTTIPETSTHIPEVATMSTPSNAMTDLFDAQSYVYTDSPEKGWVTTQDNTGHYTTLTANAMQRALIVSDKRFNEGEVRFSISTQDMPDADGGKRFQAGVFLLGTNLNQINNGEVFQSRYATGYNGYFLFFCERKFYLCYNGTQVASSGSAIYKNNYDDIVDPVTKMMDVVVAFTATGNIHVTAGGVDFLLYEPGANPYPQGNEFAMFVANYHQEAVDSTQDITFSNISAIASNIDIGGDDDENVGDFSDTSYVYTNVANKGWTFTRGAENNITALTANSLQRALIVSDTQINKGEIKFSISCAEFPNAQTDHRWQAGIMFNGTGLDTINNANLFKNDGEWGDKGYFLFFTQKQFRLCYNNKAVYVKSNKALYTDNYSAIIDPVTNTMDCILSFNAAGDVTLDVVKNDGTRLTMINYVANGAAHPTGSQVAFAVANYNTEAIDSDTNITFSEIEMTQDHNYTITLLNKQTIVDPLVDEGKAEPATYGKILRIEQTATATPTLLATRESDYNSANGWRIYRSTDDGQTWNELSRVLDTINAGLPGHQTGYQPFLYELPEAMGTFPKGTIFFAGCSRVNPSQTTSLILAYSTNLGETWTTASKIVQGGAYQPAADDGNRLATQGVWEPHLIYDNGKLYCFYSDEQDSAHSQKLVVKYTTDGVNWSAPIDVVANNNLHARPGMAIVTKMGNGQYALAFESHSGSSIRGIYLKVTNNLEVWDAADTGVRIRTNQNVGLASAPAMTWTPNGSPNGTLIITGQYNTDSSTGNANLSATRCDMFLSFDYGQTFVNAPNLILDDNDVTGLSGNATSDNPDIRSGYSAGLFTAQDGSVYYVNNHKPTKSANYGVFVFAKFTIS